MNIKKLIKQFLRQIPPFQGIYQKYERLNQEIKKQGAFPAGHYYSPIPDQEDVEAYIQALQPLTPQLPGINLNETQQLKLLQQYSQFYAELPFPEQPQSHCRYYYDNNCFTYADAIFLYSFLRQHQPRRIIEVGAGFSSAVILDTTERYYSPQPQITLIEPYPERLKSLLKKGDQDRIEIIEKKIQQVDLQIFSTLTSGDLLFIDSSHVVKCGSDLLLLFFEILPFLPPGVFVHFHDVFYPFDYPAAWLQEGRYWNENYFIRAFLTHNQAWSIHFFNTFVAYAFEALIQEKMPLCLKNTGGSLYIQRNIAAIES